MIHRRSCRAPAMRFRRARTWGRGSILRKRRYPSSARRDCSSVVLSLPARRRSFEERSSRNPCRPSPQDQAPLYVQHGKDAGIQKRACGLLTGILDNHRRPLLHRGMRTCLPHPIGQGIGPTKNGCTTLFATVESAGGQFARRLTNSAAGTFPPPFRPS